MNAPGTTLVLAAWLAGASPAAAQEPKTPRVEVAIGAAWAGGVSMASLSATETEANGAARPLVNLSRELTGSAAIEARVGFRMTSRLDVEAIGTYARPQFRVTASGDVEGAPSLTAPEQLQEFTVGGSASWFLVRRDGEARLLPFLSAGVAYARQLHETATLADSGAIVEVGGGVKRVLRAGTGRVKALGVRADLRARVRPESLSLDGRTHVSPMLGASLFLRF